jgi:hypothetical protein
MFHIHKHLYLSFYSARIIADLKKRTAQVTQFQQAALDERRTRVVRNIVRFNSMLQVYIHGQRMECRNLDNEPELTSVIMPSSLSTSMRIPLDSALLRSEIELRQAAAQESLTDLLNQLRNRQLFNTFCRSNVRGTRGTTSIAESLRRCSSKAMLAANAYRRHHGALEILDPGGSWTARLKRLHDSDIRGIDERALNAEELRARDATARLRCAVDNTNEADNNNDVDEASDELNNLPIRAVLPSETGEGRRAISWIWHNTPALSENTLTSADPSLVLGTLVFYSMNGTLFTYKTQRYEWNGPNQRSEPITGVFNLSWCARKCGAR